MKKEELIKADRRERERMRVRVRERERERELQDADKQREAADRLQRVLVSYCA